MRRYLSAVFLVTAALLCAACNGPTTPSVIPIVTTPPVIPGIAVAGKVYDTAYRPLALAVVEVLDGPNTGMTTMTTGDGTFGLRGDFDAATRFRATKDGHVAGVAKLGPRCQACNPNFWVYFNLALPVPPVDIAGDYTLMVIADEACGALPEQARRRTYAATIAAYGDQPTAANTYFRTTSDSADLVGRPGDGVFFAVAGNYVELEIGDLHGDPGLIEVTGPDSYFSFGGLGTTTLGAGGGSQITATFSGQVTHCVLKPGVTPLSSGRFTCAPESAVTRVVCESQKHQILLTRR